MNRSINVIDVTKTRALKVHSNGVFRPSRRDREHRHTRNQGYDYRAGLSGRVRINPVEQIASKKIDVTVSVNAGFNFGSKPIDYSAMILANA